MIDHEKKIKNFTLCRHLEWSAGIIFYIPQNNIPNYLYSLSIFRLYSTGTLCRKHQQLERNCGESKSGVHKSADTAWYVIGHGTMHTGDIFVLMFPLG